jgi:hypothetical protein
MTRLSLPFRLYPLGSESAARVLEGAGFEPGDLPVVIRHDSRVTVNPTLSDLGATVRSGEWLRPSVRRRR